MLSDNKKNTVIKKVVKDKAPKSGVVYLVRHGETKLNSDDSTKDRIRGWLNVPLDDSGKKEAEKIGNFLKDKKIDKMYYSDLLRTTETADIIKSKLKNVKIIKTGGLRPWNLGDLQGLPSKDVAPEIVELMKNGNKSPKNGENWKMFLTRYLGKLRDILSESEKTGENIAVVAHYRNLKVAESWYESGTDNDKIDEKVMEKWKLETGAIFKFTKNGDGWKMEHIKIN